jgi:hypothetical protein
MVGARLPTDIKKKLFRYLEMEKIELKKTS